MRAPATLRASPGSPLSTAARYTSSISSSSLTSPGIRTVREASVRVRQDVGLDKDVELRARALVGRPLVDARASCCYTRHTACGERERFTLAPEAMPCC